MDKKHKRSIQKTRKRYNRMKIKYTKKHKYTKKKRYTKKRKYTKKDKINKFIHHGGELLSLNEFKEIHLPHYKKIENNKSNQYGGDRPLEELEEIYKKMKYQWANPVYVSEPGYAELGKSAIIPESSAFTYFAFHATTKGFAYNIAKNGLLKKAQGSGEGIATGTGGDMMGSGFYYSTNPIKLREFMKLNSWYSVWQKKLYDLAGGEQGRITPEILETMEMTYGPHCAKWIKSNSWTWDNDNDYWKIIGKNSGTPVTMITKIFQENPEDPDKSLYIFSGTQIEDARFQDTAPTNSREHQYETVIWPNCNVDYVHLPTNVETNSEEYFNDIEKVNRGEKLNCVNSQYASNGTGISESVISYFHDVKRVIPLAYISIPEFSSPICEHEPAKRPSKRRVDNCPFCKEVDKKNDDIIFEIFDITVDGDLMEYINEAETGHREPVNIIDRRSPDYDNLGYLESLKNEVESNTNENKPWKFDEIPKVIEIKKEIEERLRLPVSERNIISRNDDMIPYSVIKKAIEYSKTTDQESVNNHIAYGLTTSKNENQFLTWACSCEKGTCSSNSEFNEIDGAKWRNGWISKPKPIPNIDDVLEHLVNDTPDSFNQYGFDAPKIAQSIKNIIQQSGNFCKDDMHNLWKSCVSDIKRQNRRVLPSVNAKLSLIELLFILWSRASQFYKLLSAFSVWLNKSVRFLDTSEMGKIDGKYDLVNHPLLSDWYRLLEAYEIVLSNNYQKTRIPTIIYPNSQIDNNLIIFRAHKPNTFWHGFTYRDSVGGGVISPGPRSFTRNPAALPAFAGEHGDYLIAKGNPEICADISEFGLEGEDEVLVCGNTFDEILYEQDLRLHGDDQQTKADFKKWNNFCRRKIRELKLSQKSDIQIINGYIIFTKKLIKYLRNNLPGEESIHLILINITKFNNPININFRNGNKPIKEVIRNMRNDEESGKSNAHRLKYIQSDNDNQYMTG